MEFDKSRVYTAVNAEEVKIGSKCIFARNVFILKDHVRHDYPSEILISVCSETSIDRFEGDDSEWYPLAYLIEPPNDQKELEYKPFESLNSLRNAVKRHGDNIQTKESKFLANIIGISLCSEIIINDLYGLWILPADELLNDYVFADDGSPCGELVES